MTTRNAQFWAAVWAALVAGGVALMSWLRRDAKRDATETLEKEDLQNAKSISDRVRDGRNDPDRLREFSHRGYRD